MPKGYASGRSNAAEQRPAISDYVKRLSGASLLIGAVIGLLVGLLIGWVIWPVQWSNAWPADLSPEAKAQYLVSVAQVYSYYNDDLAAETARNRLLNLNEDLATEIAAAQTFFEENPQRDSRVYITMLGQLAAGLGISSPDIIMPAPAGAETDATPKPAAETPSWLTWTLSFLGIIILVGGGIYLISKLAQRRTRVAPHETEETGDEFDDDFGVDRYGPSGVPQGSAQRTASRTGYGVQAADDYGFTMEPDDADLYSTGATIQETVEEPDEEYYDEEEFDGAGSGPVAAQIAPSGKTARQASGRVLDTFIAHYQAGVIDFDQSFKIVDPETNRYVGECGMGVNVKNGILQDDPENVIALDVWLYDQKMEKSLGNRTRVLLSEYAIDRNLEPAFMRERPNDPPPVVAQPGVSFQLKGQSLVLDCEVVEAGYATSSRDAGIFQSIKVEMTVRSRA